MGDKRQIGQRLTRRGKMIIRIALILVLLVIVIIFVFDASLSVSYYDIETDKINGQIKLVLVTDLHSCDYGEEQGELIGAIDAEQPEAVLLGGDIFDDDLPPDNAEAFIKDISSKYPCYYVSGNHEFWSGRADEFKAILESCGVTVLEGTSEILAVGGEKIRISGIDDPDTLVYRSRSVPYSEQLALLSEQSEEELFTILLSHRPERIAELLPLQPDLVLSGHAHGGQWRLPVLLENGLFSPNQGFFPEYASGEYDFGTTKMIVSRGLARESTKMTPRIFNRPEIVVVTLK
jgi:predicted MPP superfamily phosphohydrolase